jgi:isoquinoline 1-oxidoreductase beta subunit
VNASRREFLAWTAAAGAALVLPIGGCVARDRRTASGPTRRLNRWIAVRQDGRVTLLVGKSEMGQGVRTSLPMILAEELGVAPDAVDLVQAEPGPDFGDLGTDASTSIATSWKPLRDAGAAAREMLTRAAAERWKVDPASCRAAGGEIAHPPTGRRLGYGELVEAAARLPVPANPRLTDPAAFRWIGKDRRRLDGRLIVTGRAEYGIDARPPGVRHAVVLRAPRLGARLRSWEASRAKAVPGVVDVLAISSGIAIVAQHTAAAIAGRELVAAEWEDGPGSDFDSAAFEREMARAVAKPALSVRRVGDVERALAAGSRRIAAEYRYAHQAHVPMEPPNCVADARGGRCEIWTGTQTPNRLQRDVARRLGIAEASVRVHVTLLGGGFGRRQLTDFATEAAEISKAAGLPVQLLWTREDDLTHDRYQTTSLHRMRAALDPSGRPSAWHHRVIAPSVLRSLAPAADDVPGMETVGAADVPYAIPAILVDYVETPSPVPLGWWRGIEFDPNVFVRESFVDELARAAGKDPLAYRLDLLGPPRAASIGDDTLDVGRLRRVMEVAAEKAGWGSRLAERSGRGIAACAQHLTTFVAHVAEVDVAADGQWRVRRVVTAVDCGRVVNPLGVRAQMESGIAFGLSSLKTRITFTKGAPDQRTFADYPILRYSEMPAVEVHVLPSDADPTGVGEMAVPPLAPAVGNAIFDAVGVRVRELPIRADQLAAARGSRR